MQPIYKDRNLLIVFAISLCAVMGISLISPVFPKIIEAFNIKASQVTLLITVLTVPGVFLSPIYGVIIDRYGRKRVLVPLLVLFGVAGSACGITRDFNMLLVFRFFQGIGLAGLFTLNNTIIGDLYTGRDRLKAMGLNASVISIGTAAYPAIGGALANLHWSAPFFLPSVSIVVAILALTLLENPEPRHSMSLRDYMTGAVGGLSQWKIVRLFFLSFLTFALMMGPIISFVPLWMADRYHVGTLVIGMTISLSSISAAISASMLGKIGRYIKAGWILMIAFLLYAVAMFSIPYCTSVSQMLIPSVIFGIAQGLNMPTVATMIASEAPIEFRGAFMSINSLVIQFGIAIGPILAAVIHTQFGFGVLYSLAAAVAFSMSMILILNVKGLNKTAEAARVSHA